MTLVVVVFVGLIGTCSAFLAGWSLGRMWRGLDGRYRTVRRGSVVVSDGYRFEKE